MIYDTILIGGGPASLSAAVYLARANYKIAFIEKKAPGGKVVNTGLVENYLGIEGLSGPVLAYQFFNHATKSGATYIAEEVINIKKLGEKKFNVVTNRTVYETKTVVIATGSKERKLNIKGEEEYQNKGVSGCAICDAPLFKNGVMTFIGGGDAAVGEALHVMNFAKRINLIHRRDFFRAKKTLVEKLFASSKVKKYLFYVANEIIGNGEHVTKIRIKNTQSGEEKELETNVVFPYIGADPNVHIVIQSKMDTILNKDNYVVTNSVLETKIKGIFAAGDVVENKMRQIATAVGDGALVSRSIIAYLEE